MEENTVFYIEIIVLIIISSILPQIREISYPFLVKNYLRAGNDHLCPMQASLGSSLGIKFYENLLRE
jgi:hypothetical protein